jgi:hypothetical protein
MSTPIEAVIDEIVAVSASVAPWAPPLTRDQAADLLASYARHALGLSKDLPAGSSELFPRAYRPKRVASLGLGPVYATPAPVKEAPVLPIAPPAAPIAAPKPPPLPVKAVETSPAPPEQAPVSDLDPVEVVEVDPSDVAPLDLLPMWASLPGSAPLAHSPVIEASVFDLICSHYDARASISVHSLRERRPARRGASLNPLSDLANGFVAVVCEPGACPLFRFDTYTTRIGRFRSGNGENLEVHFILDFDAAQVLDASNLNYTVEREALLDYEIAEQARIADIRQKRRQASTEALLASLDNPRRG